MSGTLLGLSEGVFIVLFSILALVVALALPVTSPCSSVRLLANDGLGLSTFD